MKVASIRTDLKLFLGFSLYSMLFWSLALGCYAILRFWGLGEELFIKTHISSDLYEQDFFLQYSTGCLILGAVLGIFYCTIDFIFEKVISHNLSLGGELVLKNLIHFICTIAVFTVSLNTASTVYGLELNTQSG